MVLAPTRGLLQKAQVDQDGLGRQSEIAVRDVLPSLDRRPLGRLDRPKDLVEPHLLASDDEAHESAWSRDCVNVERPIVEQRTRST